METASCSTADTLSVRKEIRPKKILVPLLIRIATPMMVR